MFSAALYLKLNDIDNKLEHVVTRLKRIIMELFRSAVSKKYVKFGVPQVTVLRPSNHI